METTDLIKLLLRNRSESAIEAMALKFELSIAVIEIFDSTFNRLIEIPLLRSSNSSAVRRLQNFKRTS